MIKPEDLIQLSRPEAYDKAREINKMLAEKKCNCTCHSYVDARGVTFGGTHLDDYNYDKDGNLRILVRDDFSKLDYHVDAPILNE